MLRLATAKDLPFIRQLAEQVFSQFGDYRRILGQFFYSSGVVTFIWEIDAAPAGLAMLERVWDRQADSPYLDLLAIAIDPSQQRHGLGSQLLSALFEWAQQQGASSIWLSVADTNLTAQRFFIRHGFSLISKNDGYYPAGQRAFRMTKRLGA